MEFPKMSAMRSELKRLPDADVVDMYINEERATALHFYTRGLVGICVWLSIIGGKVRKWSCQTGLRCSSQRRIDEL